MNGLPTYTKVPRTTLWLLPEGPGVAALYVGKSVITNAQYEAFDPAHARAAVASGDDEPVVGVSFDEAAGYCEWYARISQKAFRLPTDAEWDHACRSGREGRWPWGDDASLGAARAWTLENSAARTHDVESLRANPFGLHDTIGLAWEWTSSPGVPAATRLVRGGSFRTPLAEATCDVRRVRGDAERRDDVGFRIVRPL